MGSIWKVNDKSAKQVVLSENGFKKTMTEGLFKHETDEIVFTLVVDDFAVKYTTKEDVDHLITCARQKYKKCKVDRDAKQYIGINMKWDYEFHPCKIDWCPDNRPIQVYTWYSYAVQ